MTALTGGSKLDARLRAIAGRLGKAGSLRVGFLEGGTYPGGASLPLVAATQEFGGTVVIPAHTVQVFRRLNKSGEFERSGRFVKRAASNFQTSHQVAAYSVTIPARPFMRPAVAAGRNRWGAELATMLAATNYDAGRSLGLLGEQIAGEIRGSILAVTAPALAPQTVRRKGTSKPLVNTGHMLNSVDFEVSE